MTQLQFVYLIAAAVCKLVGLTQDCLLDCMAAVNLSQHAVLCVST